jgi:phosphatidate cytidylyltransferase
VTATPAKKSDLGVRALSAIVMIAVAGTALWLGGWTWTLFVSTVAIVCLGEFIRLIWLATSSPIARISASVFAVLYVGIAARYLERARHSFIDETGLRDLGLVYLLSILLFVIATDVGAYFAGRAIGGPKIAPSISPSKTWAGLAGGMLAASLWSICALYLPDWLFEASVWKPKNDLIVPTPLSHYVPTAMISGAILAVIAQAGDFFESWLKRRAGVKDSSNLIPGHGGVFDRADGILPVALVCGVFGDWLILGDWFVQ